MEAERNLQSRGGSSSDQGKTSGQSSADLNNSGSAAASSSAPPRAKKACNFCSSKKTKCITIEGNASCASCTQHSIPCTYSAPRKRGPAMGKVEGLKQDIQRLQRQVDERGLKDLDGVAGTATKRNQDRKHTSASRALGGKYQNNQQKSTHNGSFNQYPEQVKEEVPVDVEKLLRENISVHPTLVNAHAGTTLRNAELGSDRHQNLENWKEVDFYVYQIPCYSLHKTSSSSKGIETLALLDYYFRYVYQIVPVLSYTCLADHFLDMPTHLLHSMLGLCLLFAHSDNCSSNPHQPIDYTHAKLAKAHMDIAVSRVNKDLEKVDPFYCITLMHASLFLYKIQSEGLKMEEEKKPESHEFITGANRAGHTIKASKLRWGLHFSVSVNLAVSFGLLNSNGITWKSPRGTAMSSPNLCRGIWLLLNFWDYWTFFISPVFQNVEEEKESPSLDNVVYQPGEMSFLIDVEVAGLYPSFLSEYSPVNLDHPSNIPENSLTYYFYSIPLFALLKRVASLEMDWKAMGSLEESNQIGLSRQIYNQGLLEVLASLNLWYLNLAHPYQYCRTDHSWKSLFLSQMNSIYLLGRLDLQRKLYLSLLEGREGREEGMGEDIDKSLDVCLGMCSSYIALGEDSTTISPPRFEESIHLAAIFYAIFYGHRNDWKNGGGNGDLKLMEDALDAILKRGIGCLGAKVRHPLKGTGLDVEEDLNAEQESTLNKGNYLQKSIRKAKADMKMIWTAVGTESGKAVAVHLLEHSISRTRLTPPPPTPSPKF